jgi:hypothetical protein
MKKSIILSLIIVGICLSQDMVVRVYAPSWQDLNKIHESSLDIAGVRRGEWFDIVADHKLLNKIIASSLSYEIIIYDLTQIKEEVRADYLSYYEVNDSLRQLVLNYPAICKLDSLPIPTHEGNWIYGVKISDNPHIEEDDEAGFLIDGLHHSNEWACVPVVLFFADSILSAYNVVPEITDVINTTEIYCFPIINADGYLYDYPTGRSWRKNREPFGGVKGTDPNRNYHGCAGDIEGDWGAVDNAKASHTPSRGTFCGPYVNSGDEIRALTLYVKSHIINAYMSYHSSGELVIWPWSWTPDSAPDWNLFDMIGNDMADLVECLDGGVYDRGQGCTGLYPVSGSSSDWLYSWSHYVAGLPNLSFVTEIGTRFYQYVADLDHICRQNFKALEYFAVLANSIETWTEGVVPAPDIYPLGTVYDNFTIYWHAKNSEYNNPSQWELIELTNLSIIEDDFESGTQRWSLEGFSISETQTHSGVQSLFSGSMNNMNHAATTVNPYLVQPGDSVTFWCWYDLQNNLDVAVVEISENTKEWYNLDITRFTGTSGEWLRKAYSLEDWVDKSVYIRFRSMTDLYDYNEGFYIDDVYPVCLFTNVDTIASDITDTLYQFSEHQLGEYYYYVRGYNSTWGWGDYSCLEKVEVVSGVSESKIPDLISESPNFSFFPNPFSTKITINYSTGGRQEEVELKIYDATGRLVKNFMPFNTVRIHPTSLIWDGRDDLGNNAPAGIYFVKFKIGEHMEIQKAILLK